MIAMVVASEANLLVAQSLNIPEANSNPLGTGAKIEVQQSANGTLDVGGAGASNPNATGENLRGNLGASMPQPANVTGKSPSMGLPKYSMEEPNFGPDSRGAFPGRTPTSEDVRFAEDLVLPRFRSVASDRTLATRLTERADGWRYRHVNGRWWYWTPGGSWFYWNGNQWRSSAAQ